MSGADRPTVPGGTSPGPGPDGSPFGRLVLIANPRAGLGKVGAKLPEIERTLRAESLDYRIAETREAGHATRLARDALEAGERFLVAVGGDGTVHEVVNGMFEGGVPVADDAVLGVVAAGSGCDFVKTFGLPGDAARGSLRLTGEATRRVDVARMTFRTDAGEEVTRYFPNIAECGLGGAVVARASRLPRWLGPSQYFFAFWLTLPSFSPGPVAVDVDGETFRWRAHNVVVANGRYYGGGMQISPKSQPDDGLLDVLVMVGPKRDAFTALPRIYRGTHLPHPNMVELSGRRITVETAGSFRVEADGETLGVTPATFEVVPGAIRLKV